MTINQQKATNLVEVVFQEDLTKKGLADLRKQYPKSFSLDMAKDDEFKRGRKIRTERNKLVKAINDRRISFTNELKSHGDELISKINDIYDPIVNSFEIEDKRRKDEAARIAKEREDFLNSQREEISKIQNFVEQCKGADSKFIADTIEAVDLIDTDAFDKEVIHEAIEIKKSTLDQLTSMHQSAKAEEAVRAEREKLKAQQQELEEKERKQKLALEIDGRINNLRNDPMNYFGKSSGEISERISELENFTPSHNVFGDRLDEVSGLISQVVTQLNMMKEQALIVERSAKENETKAKEEEQSIRDKEQERLEAELRAAETEQQKAKQEPVLSHEEREVLQEANSPLFGNKLKSDVFDQLSDSSIEGLKHEAFEAHKLAEKKWHAYACELPVGDERTKAFEIYENIRLATRVN